MVRYSALRGGKSGICHLSLSLSLSSVCQLSVVSCHVYHSLHIHLPTMGTPITVVHVCTYPLHMVMHSLYSIVPVCIRYYGAGPLFVEYIHTIYGHGPRVYVVVVYRYVCVAVLWLHCVVAKYSRTPL